jgi:hypothetical protein
MLAAIEEDAINRRTEFWYARVMGILHVNVLDKAHLRDFKRLDILWVRWFGQDGASPGGWKARRLERVGFVPDSDVPGAFGFIDPSDVIRGCHLIPAFEHDRRLEEPILQDSFCREGEGDWNFYYVNRYVINCALYLPQKMIPLFQLRRSGYVNALP